MRRFVNPGKRIASFTRTFARLRWALNFDGVGVRGQLANRAINPDGDIDIEFYTPSNIIAPQSSRGIVMQCITTTPANREFELFFSGGTGNLGANVGGYIAAIALAGEYAASTKYRWTLIGNESTVYDSKGNIVRRILFNRGTAREPTAQTVIGARFNGSNYLDYFVGVNRDIRINGKRYPMQDYNQAIQLSQPSGLGDELITQSVLENPDFKGSQWTYLGDGRWQYVGDGTYNQLSFIAAASQPATGFVEFEVESITGVMACSITPQSTPDLAVNSDSRFGVSNVGGKFRYYYTNKGNIGNASAGNVVEFKRGNPGLAASCIIKNISFRPLGTCNPMTISNATSTNWMQVVDDYVAKFRAVLNFDGIGVRSQLANRAINPDGNIDIEFYTGPTVNFSTSRTVVSQTLTLTQSGQEFMLFISTTGNLVWRVGGASIAATPAILVKPNSKYRWNLSGSTVTIYENGSLIVTQSFSRGAVREPSAVTNIGVTVNTFFYRGGLFDIKINGTLWPIADRNQTIQLPTPSGLGAELITQSVLENPAVKGSQWTYLGGGRWQFVGDGTFNELQLIAINSQPVAGYVEFEVESIIGQMRCFGSVGNVGTLQSNPVFASVGVFRHYFLDRALLNNGFRFSRSVIDQPASCIIKNISFKPLGTCNPITLANVTSANWEDLEI